MKRCRRSPMNVRRHSLAAVCLVLSLGSAPAWAQPQEAKLSGVVRDATGAGLPGAAVAAVEQAATTPVTVTTGADGSYSLSLGRGSYRVTASLQGFRSVTQVVEMPGGGNRQMDFSLQPLLSEEITV